MKRCTLCQSDDLVEHFCDFLGSPDNEHLIGDVGTGRGGLVGALQAEGYRPLACEASSVLVNRARELLGLDDSVMSSGVNRSE